MAETRTASKTVKRPEFFLQLQYLEHAGTVERTLFLFPRTRTADTTIPLQDFTGMQVTFESVVPTRSRPPRRRRIPYQVTNARPLAGAHSPQQGRSLWLEPTSPLAEDVEMRARQHDADGRAVCHIHLRWPDGTEERYERASVDGLWFYRS